MLYSFGKYKIASSENLHPLVPCNGNETNADFTFFMGDVSPEILGITWTIDYKQGNGAIFFSAGQLGEKHFLKFHDFALFEISLEDKEIRAYPRPNLPEHTLIHFLLDQVLPRTFTVLGDIFIHASAVCLETGLAVFLGDSGRGKSTLALSFQRAGYPAFSDDVILLDEHEGKIFGHEVYPSLRLWQDSFEEFLPETSPKVPVAHYNSKFRVQTEEIQKALPFHAFFLLGEASYTGAIRLQRLSEQEAFITLLKSAFHFHKPSRALLEKEFDFFGSIIANTPLFLLEYPRQYGLLNEVRSLILELGKNHGLPSQ